MNGVRSISMRKGYLLTALVAAVLLAASSGTAYAQTPSLDFESPTVTVREEASGEPAPDNTNPWVRVNLMVSGLPSGPIGTSLVTGDTPRRKAIKALGTLSFVGNSAATGSQIAFTVEEGGADAMLSGVAVEDGLNALEMALELDDAITLTLTSETEDDNWNDEAFTVSVTSNSSRVVNIGRPLQGTIKDKEWTPVASFDKSGTITLAEGSQRVLMVSVGASKGIREPSLTANRPEIPTGSGALKVDVSPANAVSVEGSGDVTGCTNSPAPVVISSDGTLTYANGMLTLNGLDALFGADADGAAPQMITLKACPKSGDFGDVTVMLSFNGRSLMTASGSVAAGPDVMIGVENDDPVPTLSFTPTDVTIDEGASTSTVLLAEGEGADKVGMVKLMVEGDAMVDLYQGDMMLEEMDGYVMVDLDGNMSVRLTAMSLSDPDLMTDYTLFKAWKLVEGGTDGAAISDDYWFRVDVIGSTAVPALPLLGQLLLALFLMAGGARLYRRRQG